MPGIALDHIVLGAVSLDAGAAYLAERFGVEPDSGGQHRGVGTWNRLLQLGGGTYLELIAPDPTQPDPPRQRPFGLDDPAVRTAIAVRPRLLHYLVRTDDIGGARRALGFDPGEAIAMSRGDLSWKVTIGREGRPPAGGALPGLIDWCASTPPGRTLPARGVLLQTWHVGADPHTLALLAPLALADRRVRLYPAAPPRLAAELSTPRGWALLD